MGRRLSIVALTLGFALLSAGCVERRFRIESNPPGAYVSVNNVPYGPTPVDVPFIYYGDYEITLVKEGFQTLKVKEPVSAPWYQYPVIDFFAESAWPGQLTDIRPVVYDLEPALQPNLDLLKAEAEELRKEGQALPAPRFPDPRKDTPVDERPRRTPPANAPPTEALPLPKEAPGLPIPKKADGDE